MTNLTVVSTNPPPALLTPAQVARIEGRLNGPIGNIYLAANMAAIARDARKDDDIELATVLGHVSALLMKVAAALDVAEIVPRVERTKEVTP